MDENTLYSEVGTFMKKDYAITSDFKSITTSGNKTISLTGDHPIFSRNGDADQFNAMCVFPYS